LTLFTTVWFLIWSIADFADANGFSRTDQLVKAGYKATALFSGLTSIIMLLISIITVINGIWFYKRK
jgi:hypothetical protein